MDKTSSFTDSIDAFYDKVNKLSMVQRLLICIITVVLIIAIFLFYFYLPKKKTIDGLLSSRDSLKKQLETYKTKAAQLPKYQKEMERAKEDFIVASKKLPEQKDIPELLSNISYAAKTAGLEINTFQPAKTSPQEFYAKIPVSIKANGSYHQVGLFLDSVSRLSRIVNVENIKMNPTDVSCSAVTYMFVEQDVNVNNKSKTKKK